MDRQDIKRCHAEADAFWAGWREEGSGADGAADEERAEEVRDVIVWFWVDRLQSLALFVEIILKNIVYTHTP